MADRPTVYGRTLGPVELSVRGAAAPAELLWRKHLALLIYLARSPRRTRARDHLVGLLWGEKDETAARHSLREAIRILRRAMGEEAVTATAQQLGLAEDAIRLDVDELEVHAAREAWADAAALVGGEFLEGLSVPGAAAFEDWLESERFRWRRRSVEVLARRGEELLAQGHSEDARDLADRALRLDPLAEQAVQLGLRAAAVAGLRAEALALYDAFAARLRGEVRAEPDAETEALIARIRDDRSMRLRVPEPPAPPRVRLPLVGRENELARLEAARAACASERQATAIMIAGDPGFGKSRLLKELTDRAGLSGAAVALVRAVAADAGVPESGALTLADAGLRDAPGVAGADPGSLAAFAARLPRWAERFPGVRAAAARPLREAFREIVAAVVEEAPVLLAVDDAEWLDPESLETLEALLRDLADRPFATALTMGRAAIPVGVDRLRARIGRELAGVAVTLEPLSHAMLRELAARVLPQYGAAELDRVTRRVATDSAGIPLLAVELLQAITLGMDLDATGAAAWPEPFRTLDQTLPGDLPDAVVAAIRVRFRGLSANAQLAVQAAALLDDRFVPADVARMTELPDPQVLGALDEIEWHFWVRGDSRGYSFVARILRDVIAQDMLTPGQRTRLLGRLRR